MGKGVVSAIWEDDCMPVDDEGVRADIIMTPASTINRMNPSQMFEQFWNRCSLQVLRNIRNKYLGGYQESEGKQVDWVSDMRFRKNWKEMYNYILGYMHDFRPAYAKFVNETLVGRTDEKTNDERMSFVEDCLNSNTIYLINAFRDPVTSEHLIEVANKYGVKRSQLTYKVKDDDTGEYKTIRTLNKTLIGSKYLVYLGKVPSSFISAIEIGHVNQFENPIKPKSKHVKSQAIIGLTPQKFGKRFAA